MPKIKKKTIKQKITESKVSESTYYKRINEGWSEKDALETPTKYTNSISKQARDHGLQPSIVLDRLKLGWTLKEALETPKRKLNRWKKQNQNSKAYCAWKAIHSRCYNPKNKSYHIYGGSGIIVCERWKNNYDNFFEDMGAPPSKSHSIDRIDSGGNYEPGNCRWATAQQQARNTRSAKNSSSKFKGVHWDKISKKWVSQIWNGYRKMNLGRYNKEEDAAKAYDKAAIEYFGSDGVLNYND